MTNNKKTNPSKERAAKDRKAPGGRCRAKLIPFDAARYLASDDAVAAFLDAALEIDDPALLVRALGEVARARGMSKVAKDSGLGRESLYKALDPKAKPRFETIARVARSLGVRLAVRVA